MRTPPLHSELSASTKGSCDCCGAAEVDMAGVEDSGASPSLSVALMAAKPHCHKNNHTRAPSPVRARLAIDEASKFLSFGNRLRDVKAES